MKKTLAILNVAGQWLIIVIALVMIPYKLQGRLTTIEVTQQLMTKQLDRVETEVKETRSVVMKTLITDIAKE
jgi:hypothetical protein